MNTILPTPDSPVFLTDAGIETYIEYKKGFEFPNFCLFNLLSNADVLSAIDIYFRDLLKVA